MSKEYGKIKRGFKSLLPRMEKAGNYIASCNSCAYFYSKGMEEECCHNEGITQFDVCQREDGTYFCCYWRSVGMEKKSLEKEEKGNK